MTRPEPTREEDEHVLRALELRADGLSHREIAKRCGGTKNRWIGLMSRIRDALGDDTTGHGTMPRGWWKGGD